MSNTPYCACTNKRTISGRTCGDCRKPLPPHFSLADGDKDYDTPCEVCGEKPTVHPTGLCGPCCFGEAETYGGNW